MTVAEKSAPTALPTLRLELHTLLEGYKQLCFSAALERRLQKNDFCRNEGMQVALALQLKSTDIVAPATIDRALLLTLRFAPQLVYAAVNTWVQLPGLRTADQPWVLPPTVVPGTRAMAAVGSGLALLEGSAMRHEGTQPTAVVSLSLEEAQRMETQEAIRASVQAHLPILWVMEHPEGTIAWLNRNALPTYEVQGDDFLGCTSALSQALSHTRGTSNPALIHVTPSREEVDEGPSASLRRLHNELLSIGLDENLLLDMGINAGLRAEGSLAIEGPVTGERFYRAGAHLSIDHGDWWLKLTAGEEPVHLQHVTQAYEQAFGGWVVLLPMAHRLTGSDKMMAYAGLGASLCGLHALITVQDAPNTPGIMADVEQELNWMTQGQYHADRGAFCMLIPTSGHGDGPNTYLPRLDTLTTHFPASASQLAWMIDHQSDHHAQGVYFIPGTAEWPGHLHAEERFAREPVLTIHSPEPHQVSMGSSMLVITFGPGVWLMEEILTGPLAASMEVVELTQLHPLNLLPLQQRLATHGKGVIVVHGTGPQPYAEALAGKLSRLCFQQLDAPFSVISAATPEPLLAELSQVLEG